MGVAKFSVSFDHELGDAVRLAAEAEGLTVSAWMAEAARERVRNLILGQVIDEFLAETGLTRDDLERAAAEARANAIEVRPRRRKKSAA